VTNITGFLLFETSGSKLAPVKGGSMQKENTLRLY